MSCRTFLVLVTVIYSTIKYFLLSWKAIHKFCCAAFLIGSQHILDGTPNMPTWKMTVSYGLWVIVPQGFTHTCQMLVPIWNGSTYTLVRLLWAESWVSTRLDHCNFSFNMDSLQRKIHDDHFPVENECKITRFPSLCNYTAWISKCNEASLSLSCFINAL